MYSISSRSHTPRRSVQHSLPVPIPHSSAKDLPTANALRYKHLHGYTQTSTDDLSGPMSVTDSSEGDHEDYVVDTPVMDTPEMGIVIDERDGISISSESTASSSTGTVSTSPPVFPLSRSTTIAPGSLTFGTDTLIEDVEQVLAMEEKTQTPLVTSRSPVVHLPPTTSSSFANVYFPAGLTDNSSTTSSIRHRSFSASPQVARKALERRDDEFRCQTCYHAGICADLVMKDSNFRCNDIDSLPPPSGELSSGASTKMRGVIRGKTPWARQMLSGVDTDDVTGKAKLRLLDGGMDYVHYDEPEGLRTPGSRRELIDLEDLAKGMQAGSKAHPSTPQSALTTAVTTFASGSAGTSQSGSVRRPFRQTWTATKVEDSVSTSDNLNEATGGTLSTCANSRVRLEPVLEGLPAPTSAAKAPPIQDARRPRLGLVSGRGRSRSHHNPVRTLHNPTWGLLSGRSWDNERLEEKYDYDDKLYGLDVVERGRSRVR
ncbi:hypothetical protein NliqN6_3564 [Naganishia liquefaciens]|uniref:Uncharacterized protein n=1 Tax=Naganishia liquefaciens TaxID=104408 RepID=A0A8H3YGE9_9TREE|nr:hypothetical protein NliqN6_3564 [Naganishia liquefaciens]